MKLSMMNKIRNLLQIFILLVISLWFILSLGRVAYNIYKVFTTEKEWLSLTNDQKKIKIFGDLHVFFSLISQKTKSDSKITIILPDAKSDPRVGYLGIYYLYPRDIIFEAKTTDKSDYVVTYYPNSYKKLPFKIHEFFLVEKYHGEQFSGELYKIL